MPCSPKKNSHIFSKKKFFLRKQDFSRKLDGGTGLQRVRSNLNLRPKSKLPSTLSFQMAYIKSKYHAIKLITFIVRSTNYFFLSKIHKVSWKIYVVKYFQMFISLKRPLVCAESCGRKRLTYWMNEWMNESRGCL